MKTSLIAMLAAGGVALASQSAMAADFSEPAAAGYNWSGIYIGIGGGAGAFVGEAEIPGLPASFNGIGGEGVFGELTLGYDYMVSPRFLIGAFADGRFGNVGSELTFGADSIDVDADYGFDVGLRAGYLLTPSTLAYVLGGYSWQHFDVSSTVAGIDYDWDSSGFVVGAGVETVIASNWTLKSEYRYSHYASEDFDTAGFVEVTPSAHTFHAGLNYRFGMAAGGTSFDAPAYDWNGLTIGAALGAGGLVHDLSVPAGPLGFNGIGAEGIFAEASIGYDMEFAGGWVAGVMADARISSVSTDLSAPGLSASIDADYGFDVLARLGYKVSPGTLVYALGGYSHQHFEVDVSGVGTFYDWDSNGFSVGGGIETAVADRTTFNLEYRYSDYGTEDFDGIGFEVDPSAHTVRAGLKFKLM
ncbi:outer membrane protein [Nitratireductor basaltis]|uniref:Outer membrane protein-like protein n=1 Tax=Nitratireductor basaltis TaxID=472175 RepID=A0A084UD14_9HYPH|nr:outer membrane beta-barrel protein [Nitratireductor basaltis]KFB10850.1 Outer membrane protein-like protein [Nitratireductor basaltis]